MVLIPSSREYRNARTQLTKQSTCRETRGTFALVIGIDEYECGEYGDLVAAVADADRFQDYLLEDLKTPREHIISLRNGQATRKAIIDGFKSLICNPRIVQGMAAVIIYYSGHGAVAPKPDEWTDWQTYDNEIEMLCPTDIGILDTNDRVVEGIPDRTISELLLELATAKGNNIVCRSNLDYSNDEVNGCLDINSRLLSCCWNQSWNATRRHTECEVASDPQPSQTLCQLRLYDALSWIFRGEGHVGIFRFALGLACTIGGMQSSPIGLGGRWTRSFYSGIAQDHEKEPYQRTDV